MSTTRHAYRRIFITATSLMAMAALLAACGGGSMGN